MFNNRIDENGRITFLKEEWTCTDPDEMQFCRVVDKHTFEYIQLKEKWLDLFYEECKLGKNFIDAISGVTTADYWIEDEIDVNNYDEEEIAEYLSSYGGILDGVSDETSRNQLIAECIFETDCVFSGDYDDEELTISSDDVGTINFI